MLLVLLLGAGVIGLMALQGFVLIIFGTATPVDIDLATFASGSAGFRLLKGSLNAIGTSLGSAGDVNNDGKDDVLVAAGAATFSERSSAGAVFVLFGRVGPYSDIDLSTMTTGPLGYKIIGYAESTFLASPYRTGAGAAWVIFGNDTSVADIDLASLGSAGIVVGFAGSAGKVHAVYGHNAVLNADVSLGTLNG
eukprot:gene16558-18888_t